MKILCYGEILWDEYADNRYIGGALFNFSAHLVKSGVTAYLYTAIGCDELGDSALEMVKSFGVEDNFVCRIDKPTGKCEVTLNKDKIPVYDLKQNVAYDYIPYCEQVEKLKFDALAFGSLALRNDNNIKTLERILLNAKIGKVFCDLNLREPFFSEHSVDFCLSHASFLKLSEDELNFVAKSYGLNDGDLIAFCEGLKKRFLNIQTVIITLGEKGAYCYEDKLYFCHSEKVNVVSTVGAGDSFGATFLAEYLSGKDIPACLKKATVRAGYVVSHFGAVPD